VDFIDMDPIPARLQAPLQSALRGESGNWPADLAAGELRALTVHGVAPLVFATGAVPSLRSEAVRAAALEALRFEDVRQVMEVLADAGVPALILKGTALAYDLYAAPELRPRGDTDLLIDERMLERARSRFLQLGFAEQPITGDEHGTRQTVFTRADSSGIVHMYDVHWAITNTPVFASVLRFDDLLSRSRALPALGRGARGLGDVDALLLACIHRVAHHHDSDRLIWLVDIALLRSRMTRAEHEEFWRTAADAKIINACVRSVERAEEWIPGPPRTLAHEWLSSEQLAAVEPSQLFLDRDATHGQLMLANLRALHWKARVQRLWQVAFPPAAFVQESFGVRSRLALPWLYARRGLRGLRRLFRRVSAS
jgi:hypothetical protein